MDCCMPDLPYLFSLEPHLFTGHRCEGTVVFDLLLAVVRSTGVLRITAASKQREKNCLYFVRCFDEEIA